MNWGNRLVLVFIGFALLIGTLVYKSMHVKYELVSKDYYGDELRYQEKIDGMNNAVLAGDITLRQENRALRLVLPDTLTEKSIPAEAWFYCKTDAVKDKKLHINIQDGQYLFETDSFAKDNYELKLQFTAYGKKYYYTTPINIQ
jgi:hypothetical protein